MNTDLLLSIADAIELNAEKFNMSDYVAVNGYETITTEEDFFVRCDTQACVAGWATILSGQVTPTYEKNDWVDYQKIGKEQLDLTPDQAQRLFYCWEDSVWHEHADDYGWDEEMLTHDSDDWSVVDAHSAADLLRRVAKGEVEL